MSVDSDTLSNILLFFLYIVSRTVYVQKGIPDISEPEITFTRVFTTHPPDVLYFTCRIVGQ